MHTHTHTHHTVQYTHTSFRTMPNEPQAVINKWVSEGIRQPACAVVPSHLLLCPYRDLCLSLVAHWPSGTNTSQASPSHTPTTPAVRLCVSVCMCACVPPRRGTTLSKCHRRVSVKPCCASHPHSRLALLRRRRLHIECDGRHVVFVYSPHAKNTPRLPPGPHPPRHISQPVSPSSCLRTAVSLYPHSARLWSTVSYQPRSASLQPARRKAACYLALWCQTPWNTLIGRPVSWYEFARGIHCYRCGCAIHSCVTSKLSHRVDVGKADGIVEVCLLPRLRFCSPAFKEVIKYK